MIWLSWGSENDFRAWRYLCDIWRIELSVRATWHAAFVKLATFRAWKLILQGAVTTLNSKRRSCGWKWQHRKLIRISGLAPHTNLDKISISRLLFNIDQRHKLYYRDSSTPQARILAKMTTEWPNVSSDLVWEITRMFLFISFIFFFWPRNDCNILSRQTSLHYTIRQPSCNMLI